MSKILPSSIGRTADDGVTEVASGILLIPIQQMWSCLLRSPRAGASVHRITTYPKHRPYRGGGGARCPSTGYIPRYLLGWDYVTECPLAIMDNASEFRERKKHETFPWFLSLYSSDTWDVDLLKIAFRPPHLSLKMSSVTASFKLLDICSCSRKYFHVLQLNEKRLNGW